MILVVHGKAFELSSCDGETVTKEEVYMLRSNQEETDSRVILYADYGAKKAYKSIKVRSPDSDVFFILLHHAPKLNANVYFDTGKGNSRRIFDISKISETLGQKQCSSLLALHAFTGCDSTSAFRGIGKVKPIKVLEKKKEFEDPLVVLGESWNVVDSTLHELEEFTCAIYGHPRFKSLDLLRLHLLKKKCMQTNEIDPNKSVDLATLPPCTATLKQHIKRTNFQLKIWKDALEPFQELPSAEHHGWKMEDGCLEPNWCETSILPEELELLLDDYCADEDDDLEIVFDSDYSETSDEDSNDVLIQ